MEDKIRLSPNAEGKKIAIFAQPRFKSTSNWRKTPLTFFPLVCKKTWKSSILQRKSDTFQLLGFSSFIHRYIRFIASTSISLHPSANPSASKDYPASHPRSLCPCVISSQHSRAAMLLRYPLHSGLGAFNAGIIPFPLALSFSGRVFAVYAIAPSIQKCA